MKTCSKCKKPKSLSEFHKNRYKNDGLQDSCKSCGKIRQREYQRTANGKAAILKAVKKYQKTVKGRATQRLYRQSEKAKAAQKLFREHHQNYIKAVRAVNSAVKSGELMSPKYFLCYEESCFEQAEEYHHYKGYAKEHWLDVDPLCIKCHRKLTKYKVKVAV